jgi:hypothetical protein
MFTRKLLALQSSLRSYRNVILTKLQMICCFKKLSLWCGRGHHRANNVSGSAEGSIISITDLTVKQGIQLCEGDV